MDGHRAGDGHGAGDGLVDRTGHVNRNIVKDNIKTTFEKNIFKVAALIRPYAMCFYEFRFSNPKYGKKKSNMSVLTHQTMYLNQSLFTLVCQRRCCMPVKICIMYFLADQ